ncbi:uncharacterized protein [Ptychodera flava]|uniref:uncharacterized protein isoform X1 n=1 Tax=Ptychodera flava TaxID=63121 RepID=UPI00396A9205
MSQPSHRWSYDTAFKLEVVSKALEWKSNRKTAKHFGINEKQVRQWIKAKDQLYTSSREAKRLPGAGRKVSNQALDNSLVQWLDDHRKKGNAVTGRQLQLQARRLGFQSDFKASAGWLRSFKQRHSIPTRSRTGQKLPVPRDHEEEIVQFHRQVIQLSERHQYPMADLNNMDETPLRFDMPGNRTLERQGVKTVPVNFEKRGFTAVMTVSADECPKLQKTTRHPNETDGMRESFEEVTQKIMERFHGNISTVQDISIVINSLAEFCCISTEWMDMDEKASGSLDEYSDGIDKESAKTSPLEMHIEIPTEKIPADCGDSWKTCMEREGDLQHRQIRSNGKKCGHKQVRPFCQQRGGDKKLNKCNACGKKFSNQTNLKNHLLRHIAGKSQNPECGEMFQTGEVSSQHGLIKGVSDFSEAPSPSSDHPSQGRSTRWEVYVKKGKRFLTEYVNDLFQYTSHSGPVQDGPPALSVPKK